MTEDKVALAQKRAELIQLLATPLPTVERARVQGELSVVNATIKALNTTAAAQLKAAADRRKVAGLAEAQANAVRAFARVQDTISGGDLDDDPGQTEAIDGWIDAVLMRHDIAFTRTRGGKLNLHGVPIKTEAAVIMLLINGIYAAARGQELPELPVLAPFVTNALPTPRPVKTKPKKR